MLDKPYFMEKSEWYYFDGEKFVLTELAPEEAKESLKKYYEEKETMKDERNLHQPRTGNADSHE